MNDEVIVLLKQGLTVRQISYKLKRKRTDVQAVADEYFSAQRNRKITGAAIFLLVCMVCGFLTFLSENRQQKTEGNAVQSLDVLRHEESKSGSSVIDTLGREFMENRAPDSWFISDRDIMESEDPSHSPAKMFNILNKATEKLDEGLKKYQSIPEVKKLASIFAGRFYVSTFSGRHGGTSRRLIPGDVSPDQVLKDLDGKLEVVYYAQGDRNAERIQNQFAKYDAQWHSLILSAVTFTDVWRDALVIHELVHARLDREGAQSAHSSGMTDVWIGEELLAHKAERDVLNLGSGNAYARELGKLVNKYPGAKTPKEFIHSLNIEDMQKLDSLFSQATQRESNMRISQFLMDLGNVWIEKRLAPEKVQAAQIRHYRDLFSHAY